MQKVSFQNVGAPNTPQEIKRLRRQNMDMLRKLGQPVVFRHRWNNRDVKDGIAKPCPACFDPTYRQIRVDCPVCFSVGFVSVADDPQFWITTKGRVAPSDDGTGVKAPLFGGFDQPYLTWLIEPDVAVDVFKILPNGVMVKTQNAQGFGGWYPILGDNDLCINVLLSKDGSHVERTDDRYELKMVQPVTIRGWGRNTISQEHTVGQTFEMARLPLNNPLYNVPLDQAFADRRTLTSLGLVSDREDMSSTSALTFGLVVPGTSKAKVPAPTVHHLP